jgi:hypothetical protein
VLDVRMKDMLANILEFVEFTHMPTTDFLLLQWKELSSTIHTSLPRKAHDFPTTDNMSIETLY